MASSNSLNIISAGLVKFDGTTTFSGVTVTQYNTLVGAASNGITSVAPSATVGVPLISQGTGVNPVYGTVVVAGGGTGLATLTAHALQVGNGTGTITQLSVGATGTVLGGVTGADPAFTATPAVTSITLSGGTALSAYVQGTFTPAVGGSSSDPSCTYAFRSGTYTKIGNVVRASATVILSAYSGGSGNLQVTGLPFTSSSATDSESPIFLSAVTYTGDYITAETAANTTLFLFRITTTVIAGAYIPTSGGSASTAFVTTLVYQT